MSDVNDNDIREKPRYLWADPDAPDIAFIVNAEGKYQMYLPNKINPPQRGSSEPQQYQVDIPPY